MPDSAILTAIASPRRCEILRLVWKQERTAGEIHQAMPDVTFGAISQQLAVLHKAGAVEVRGEARFRYYRARRRALGPVARMLEAMWDDALWSLKLAAELEESRRGPASGKRRPGPRRASQPSPTPGTTAARPAASKQPGPKTARASKRGAHATTASGSKSNQQEQR